MRVFAVLFLLLSLSSHANNVVYETDWIDDNDMTSTLRDRNDNRLFPCEVEGKVEGIKILYRASYCPFLADMNFFYSRWGLSDTWYEKWAAYYKSIGMTEHSHTTFIDLSGNTVNQATWILIGEFIVPEEPGEEAEES